MTHVPSGRRSRGRCSPWTNAPGGPRLCWRSWTPCRRQPFLDLDPPQRRQRTLDGLKRVLLREARCSPAPGVRRPALDRRRDAGVARPVGREPPTAPLLLLVNYRPNTSRLGSKTYYTQLRLDPLPPASARHSGTAAGDDSSVAPPHRCSCTHGRQSLLLEESVRTLIETGSWWALQGYRLVHPPGHADAGHVQAVLAARIDRPRGGETPAPDPPP